MTHSGAESEAARDKTEAQAELLFNRLSKRYRHLKKWARRTGTNAFRLYDRDIPEIPLVLELYDDAVSGALYARPYEKDEAEEDAWLRAMKAAAGRALDIPEDRVFLKERRRLRQRRETGNQYAKMSGQNVYRDVREDGLVFRVNLSDYLDTGLFLDARKKRALIRVEAAGKRVLNLFAYTCSLSVAAAKGGARQVDSVDLSNTYLEWGRINFALNGLGVPVAEGAALHAENRLRGGAGSPAARTMPSGGEARAGSAHGKHGRTGGEAAAQDAYSFIRGDVMRFLAEAARKNLRWDIIILDAPSFSNSKKMRGTLDIRRDHGELIRNCLSLLSPGGKLWFSANAKGGFDLGGFAHGGGPGADFPGFTVKDMRQVLTDEDFRGKKIPFCTVFIRESGL